MKYKALGNSGLGVSEICLGTMNWGEQNTREEAWQQLDYAVAQGVNFIDTAEMYPVPPSPATYGATETFIGEWFARRGNRDRVILATKVAGSAANNDAASHIRGGARLTEDQVLAACDTSLKRLQTDYIDLYQVHWPDRKTNNFGTVNYQHEPGDGEAAIAETLGALEKLVGMGKIRHYGVSNETPWGVMEYQRQAQASGAEGITSIQNPYSLVNRAFEVGLAELSIRETIPLLAYSPLAFGILTGKYLSGARPENARLTLYDRFARMLNPQAERAVEAYQSLAREQGYDLAQMALAFVNEQEFVGSTIIGATGLAQLKKDIASVDVVLTDDVREGIQAIYVMQPNPAP